MGLTAMNMPPSEVVPGQIIDSPLIFEYYPSMKDPPIEESPVVRLTIKYRNHVAYPGSDSFILDGHLSEYGDINKDGYGWTFTFDSVSFSERASGAVWSLKASVFVKGEFKDDAILHGILVLEKFDEKDEKEH